MPTPPCSTASRSGWSSSRSCAGASAASTRPPSCARAPRRAAAELAEGERADERIARAAAALATAEKTTDRIAASLRKRREAAGKPFAQSVERHLADMGMDGARLEVSLADAPLGPRGRDAVELRLAANPGLPAGPLGSVASGGELSRIALAVRLAARDGGATEMLVFDEVDAGIGGRTARVADGQAARALRHRAGALHHAPAADRGGRRPPLPGREDAGRDERGACRRARRPTTRSRSSCACSAPMWATPTRARWRSACAAPRTPEGA